MYSHPSFCLSVADDRLRDLVSWWCTTGLVTEAMFIKFFSLFPFGAGKSWTLFVAIVLISVQVVLFCLFYVRSIKVVKTWPNTSSVIYVHFIQMLPTYIWAVKAEIFWEHSTTLRFLCLPLFVRNILWLDFSLPRPYRLSLFLDSSWTGYQQLSAQAPSSLCRFWNRICAGLSDPVPAHVLWSYPWRKPGPEVCTFHFSRSREKELIIADSRHD